MCAVIGWAGVFDTFGCGLVGLEADACARYYVDVGRCEHGRDVWLQVWLKMTYIDSLYLLATEPLTCAQQLRTSC